MTAWKKEIGGGMSKKWWKKNNLVLVVLNDKCAMIGNGEIVISGHAMYYSTQ